MDVNIVERQQEHLRTNGRNKLLFRQLQIIFLYLLECVVHRLHIDILD
jgi:hypothetical protein